MPEVDINLSGFRTEIADALADGGTQSFLRLTDEELAVLDPIPADTSIVSTPHLSSLGTEQRNWVMATALRSLVAREVIEITNIKEIDSILRNPHGEPTAQVDMLIQPDVDLVLTLRRTADRALAASQETTAGKTYSYTYVHTPELLLMERVTMGGLHLFTLVRNIRDAAIMLRSSVDPFGVADQDGPAQELHPSMLDGDGIGPLAKIIEEAHIVGHLVLLTEKPGPMMVTYGTDFAIWTVTVDRPHAPAGIQAQQVGRETLTRRITDMLS